MKNILIVLLIILCSSLGSTAQNSRLVAENGNVYFENGEAAQLRGISLSWSVWGGAKYYKTKIVDELIDKFSINVLRVSMAIEPDEGYLQNRKLQLQRITPVIDRAIERGIYVIMDWHDHHADKNIKEAADFFDKFSKKYAKSNLIIYEIWNEPEAINWKIVKNYSEQIIPVIRANDPKNLIVVGSSRWDQDVDIVANDPLVGFDNIAYSFHFYASDPGHQEGLREKANKAIKAGLPLFITEWGVGESNGDGVFDLEKTQAWMNWMEKNKLSWVNWNLTDKKETTALVNPGASAKGGWKSKDLTPSGQYIQKTLLEYNKK